MVLPVAVFCQTIGPWIAHITYKAGCVAGILGLWWWSGTPGFSWVAGNFCPSLLGNWFCGCHFYFWLSYLLDVTLSLIAQQLHFWHLFLTALRLKCRICLIRVLLHPFIDWFLFFLLSFFFFIYSFCPSFQPSAYLSDNKKCVLFADVGVEQLNADSCCCRRCCWIWPASSLRSRATWPTSSTRSWCTLSRSCSASAARSCSSTMPPR